MPLFRKYNLNPDTLQYELHKPGKWEKRTKTFAKTVFVCGAICMYVWLYVSVFKLELPKTAILRKTNTEYKEQISILNRDMAMCEDALVALEDRDNGVYRSIFGLNSIQESQRLVGFEGVNRYAPLDSSGASLDLKMAKKRMDVLLKRTQIQSMSLDQIYLLSSQAGNMASCLPAVPPICPIPGSYRISSSFGGRRDPVYGGWRFHEGIDMASKPGNPVYATGDGVVESVNFRFIGYGNEIVINHGYGYKTRYAHLKTVNVAEGMKVSRGQQIAELGNSGKSTGPHLHYEVIYRGKRVNPYNYFDLSMDPAEYRAMLDAQKAQEVGEQRTTMSDIVRRIEK